VYAGWRQRLITEYADRSELHTFVFWDWSPQWRYADGVGGRLGVTVGLCSIRLGNDRGTN